MESYTFMVVGALEVVIGGVWLGQIIRNPPADQPPRVFIGRVLMPVSPILFGATMLIQPITAQTFILPLIASILTFTALFLQVRYRPA